MSVGRKENTEERQSARARRRWPLFRRLGVSGACIAAMLVVAGAVWFSQVGSSSSNSGAALDSPALPKAQSLAKETDAGASSDGGSFPFGWLFGEDDQDAGTSGHYQSESLEKLGSAMLIIDGNGAQRSLDDVPAEDYSGFLFKLSSEEALASELSEKVASALDAGQIKLVHDDVYSIDSLDVLASLFDADCLEYVEPNYRMHLIGEIDGSTDEVQGSQTSASASKEATSRKAETEDARSGAVASEMAEVAPFGGTDANPAPDYPPTDPEYVSGALWNLDMLNVQGAWMAGLDGDPFTYNSKPLRDTNVRVVVIDTGLYGTGASEDQHEDLDYQKMFSGTNFVTDDEGTPDAHGHGTFVAGLIAAKANNGLGVVGAMPGVEVVSEKVFDTGSASTENVIQAIYAAVDEDRADVINMSLGGEYNERSLEAACNYAVSKGVLVVASAGNDGVSTPNYPAAYDSVVGVASVNSAKSRSTWSQYGRSVFVTAPGENVRSTFTGASDSYKTASGTSFSGPEVAALAAMCKSVYPDIDQDTFKRMLIETSEDLGGKGYDDFFGWGLVDFSKMAQAALASQVMPWYSIAFDLVDEDGRTIDAASATITVKTDEDVAWEADPENGIDEAGSWPEGTQVQPDDDATFKLHRGTYAYTVVADGRYTTSGTFKTYAVNQRISVTMPVAYDVTVNAVDSAGQAITDAILAVESQAGRAEEPKSSDGNRSVFGLASGIYSYEATAEGYENAAGTFTVQRAAKVIDAVLYRTDELTSVSFDVREDDGQTAINGATITVVDSSGVTLGAQPDGAFLLAKGKTYTARASKGGFESSSREFAVSSDASQTVVLTMRRASNKITFNVVDQAGKKISTAEVKVADSSGERVEPLASSKVQFGLSEGDYTYEATAPGYTTKTGSFGVALDSYTIKVDLEVVPSKIAFNVIDAQTGEVISGATVKVNKSDSLRAIEQNGPNTYMLGPGSYDYTVYKQGYQIALGTFVVTGEATVDVELEPQAEGDGFAGGTGSADDPYLIATEGQLRYLAEQTELVRVTSTSAPTNKKETLEGHYKLVNDIELADGPWLPIGNYENGSNYVAFGGEFDGAGHKVSGMSIVDCVYDYQGFFGYVRGAYIHDLVVDGEVHIDGKSATAGGSYAGGIVGGVYYLQDPIYTSNNAPATTIERCGNLADITGRYAVGGIVGSAMGSIPSTGRPEGIVTDFGIIIRDCFNKGDLKGMLYGSYTRQTGVGISAAGRRVGGIVGSAQFTSVENCYNAGEVQAGSVVGGVAGYAAYSGIATSYNSGMTYQYSDASGDGGTTGTVIGESVQTSLTDTFGMKRDDNYSNMVWGVFTRSESNNASSLEHAEMYRNASFVEQVNTNTSGDSTVTSEAFALGNDYPLLHWETVAGQKLAPTPVIVKHPQGIYEVDAYVQGSTATALEAEIEPIDEEGCSVSWQWFVSDTDSFKDAKPAQGGVGSGFTATHVPATDEAGVRYYFCVFTSRLGLELNANEASAATKGAVIYVRSSIPAEEPVITHLNPNGTANVNLEVGAKQGTDMELSVTAAVSDGGELTYQWYRSDTGSGAGTAVKGATDSTFNVDTSVLGTSYYYVEVTNTTGVGNSTKKLSDWIKTTVDPYSISTYQELAAFRATVNSGNAFPGQIVYLTDDIAIPDGVDWKPIGTSESPFSGTFMGGVGYAGSEPDTIVVHKITNLNVNGDAQGQTALGLFGVVAGGTICDVQIGGHITGASNTNAGLLVGQAMGLGSNSASIENCGTLAGSSVEGAYGIGGLVGYCAASLSNCANHADVLARTYAGSLGSGADALDNKYAVGGVSGFQASGNALGCYNTGTVTVDEPSEAGIVCATRVGGVVGYAGYYSGLASCFNAGMLEIAKTTESQYESGVLYAGSVAGYLTGDNGVNNFYREGTWTRGTDSSSGIDAAEMRSAQFMKTAYFAEMLNTGTGNYSYAQFRTSDNGVPHLVWEDQNTSDDEISSAEPYITTITSLDFPNIFNTLKGTYFQNTSYIDPIIVWADTPDGGALRYEWSKREKGADDDAWEIVAQGAMEPDENGRNAQAPMMVDVSAIGTFEYRCEVFNKRGDATVEPLEESMYTPPITITVKDASGVMSLRVPDTANSEDNPWVIDSAAKMKFFADIVNGAETYRPITDPTFAGQYVELEADIDIGEYADWRPVGSNASTHEPTTGVFKGIFDGAGHTISGLTIQNPLRKNYNALFGQARMATIRNLEVAGTVRMDSGLAFGTGGVVAYGYGCFIENVVNRVDVIGAVKTGGIVGYAVSCNILDCENLGIVTMNDEIRSGQYGGYDVGGIAGYISLGESAASAGAGIYNCLNNGTVSGGLYDGNYRIGAIVGGFDGAFGASTMAHTYYREGSIVVEGGSGTGVGGGSYEPIADASGFCMPIESTDNPEVAWALDTSAGASVHSMRWGNFARADIGDAAPCVHLVRPPATSPSFKIDVTSESAVIRVEPAEYAAQGELVSVTWESKQGFEVKRIDYRLVGSDEVVALGEGASSQDGDGVQFAMPSGDVEFVVEADWEQEHAYGLASALWLDGSDTPDGAGSVRFAVKHGEAASGGNPSNEAELSALAGDEVTASITVDEAYLVKEVRVIDAYGVSVAVERVDGLTYRFTMPAADVTVQVTLEDSGIAAVVQAPSEEVDRNALHISNPGTEYATADLIYDNVVFSGTYFNPDEPWMTTELERWKSPRLYQQTYSLANGGTHAFVGLDVAKLLRNRIGSDIAPETPVSFEGSDDATLRITYSDLTKLTYSSYDATGQPVVRGLPVLLYFGIDGVPNVDGAMGIVFGQESASDDNASKRVVGLKRICVGDDVNSMQHVYAPYSDFGAICGGKANDKLGYTNLTVRVYDRAANGKESAQLVSEKVLGLDEIEAMANADRAHIHHGYYSAYLYEDKTTPTTGKFTDYYEGYDLYKVLQAAGVPYEPKAKVQFFQTGMNGLENSWETIDVSLAYLAGNGEAGPGDYSGNIMSYSGADDAGGGPTSGTLTNVKPLLLYGKNGLPLVWSSGSTGVGQYNYNYRGPMMAFLPQNAAEGGDHVGSKSSISCYLGLIEVYVDGELPSDVVDKSALEEAIAAAQAAEKEVKESADGKDVAPADKWVTPEAKAALDEAIAAAQAVADKDGATQADADAAKGALEEATQAFEGAKKAGEKAVAIASVTATDAVYAGAAKLPAPKLTVKDANDDVVPAGSYTATVTYNKGHDPERPGVAGEGYAGKATVKVTGVKSKGYTGSKSASFKVTTAADKKKAGTKIDEKTLAGIDKYTTKEKGKPGYVGQANSKTMATIAKPREKTMRVTWKAVSGATDYVVGYKRSTAKAWSYEMSGGKTEHTFANMKEGDLMEFRVAVYNGKTYARGEWTQINCRFYREMVSLKATVGKGKVDLKWGKVAGATGYQIMVATKKDMSDQKVIDVKGGSTLKYTVTKYGTAKFKSGKTYYIKMRAFKEAKNVNGKQNKYIGIQSLVRSCKIPSASKSLAVASL